MSVITGTVPFREYQTWYELHGSLDNGSRPLVVLHGGPGVPHNHLHSLHDLSRLHGIPVIIYDQLGCGQSTHLRDKPAKFWTVELFLDELDNLLAHLGIQKGYDMLGHSWGGMLAAEHAVLQPKGLRRLVLSSSPASIALANAAATRLRDQLPEDIRETLRRHEKDGTTSSPEYQKAAMYFNSKHLCRVDPLPEDVLVSMLLVNSDPTVRLAMNGSSDIHVTGSLKDWSIIERIPRIKASTLVTNGMYDEVPEEASRPFVDKIQHVRSFLFNESSHMPYLEERQRYMDVVAKFLKS